MNQTNWVIFFKEKLEGLETAYKKSSSSLSLLAFAIKMKYLNSEDYLFWAQNKFNLPILQNRFFTENKPSPDIYTKWQTAYTWSSECFPITEWDHSLIVVCLERPLNFPEKLGCIFVLADANHLEQTWNNWHSLPSFNSLEKTSSGSILARTSSQIPSKPELPQNNPQAQTDVQANILQDAPSKKSLQFEVPASFNELLTSTTQTQISQYTALEPFDQINGEVVANLDLIQVESSEVDIINENDFPENLSVDDSEISGILETENTPKLKPIKEFNDQSIELNEDFKVENAPSKIQTPDINLFNSSKPATVADENGNSKYLFILNSLRNKNANHFKESISSIFKDMKSHFEKSMILTIDTEEEKLSVFAWDENFRGATNTKDLITLGKPSIFNIVAVTGKPYHGYITVNEINEKFFEDWNNGIVPDHITITPIILAGKVVGMLAGFAEKSAYNKSSLHLAEKLSVQFSKGIRLSA